MFFAATQAGTLSSTVSRNCLVEASCRDSLRCSLTSRASSTAPRLGSRKYFTRMARPSGSSVIKPLVLSTNGLITELPDGRAILVKYFLLPNRGAVDEARDVSEQRRLSRQLASTKQFLETVLDNVPACVAAKNIEDGRYIFANSAYERFWGFSRDQVVGKNARELFGPNAAAAIEATDRAALIAPAGQYRNEFEVERGATQRMVASIRIVVRNESNKPEF